MNEKISVIIPVYNVSNYLKRCLDSVINQTYSKLEIILIDDGSTDNSGKICDDYASKDKRIKVIHKENSGLADARNVGIKNATGEYIAFLDSDDWIDLDYYEVLYEKLISTNSDIAIIGFLWVKNNKFEKPPFYLDDKLFGSDEAIKELSKDKLLTSHAWNKLFKRELWREIEFPYGKAYEDIFIMHKLFAKANQIAIISDFKHYYYVNNNSITHTPTAKNLLDEFLAFETRYNDLKDIYPELRSNLAESICASIVKIYFTYPLSAEEKKKYSDEMDKIKLFLKDREIRKELSKKRKILSISPMAFGVAMKGKKILSRDVKDKIKLIIRKKEYFNKLDTDKERIILCGSPEYGNIGDLAIAYFTKRFMEINSGKEFIEISEAEFHNNFSEILKKIKPNDILLLQGGGNLGSEYIDQEKIRTKVIKNFKDNKIIIMPQTIYFSKDSHGENVKNTIREIYSKHKDLNIFSRETISYKTMNEVFSNNNVNLVPDIVMSSTIDFENIKRSGAMLCLRSDVEGILDVDNLLKIKSTVRKKFENYFMNDTVYDTNITLENREDVLFDFWNKMRKVELVVTDRLHGMVFAAITGTPCVVIGNYNHKVKTCFNWFKDLGYIQFCDNVNEIEDALNKIDYSKGYKYPGTKFMDKFGSMKKLVGEE